MKICQCGCSIDSHRRKCDECKRTNLVQRRSRTREQRRLTKSKYRIIHYKEPKFWITEKISYWRTKYPAVLSDLTTEYLLDLYNKQESKCYYSGETMIFGAKQGKALPNTASLDRLIPEKGYVRGNVVWCTFFVNTMKGGLTENEFYQFMNRILNIRWGAI